MSETQLNPDLTERVKTILRRDLRLGPDAQIDAETPLIGGDFELDSLDMVMLVTSVEKEFGVKLTDAQRSQQAFENVGTLVRFLEQQAQATSQTTQATDATDPSASAASAAPSSGPSGVAEAVAGNGAGVDLAGLLAGLPHAEPFRFVTRLTDLAPMHHGQGVWELTGEESFFAGHFPQRPIVPGVLISEALAQLSGLVGVSASDDPAAQAGELVHVDVRFRRAVAPPAQIVLHSELTNTLEGIQQFTVRAEQGGERIADGELSLKRSAPGNR